MWYRNKEIAEMEPLLIPKIYAASIRLAFLLFGDKHVNCFTQTCISCGSTSAVNININITRATKQIEAAICDLAEVIKLCQSNAECIIFDPNASFGLFFMFPCHF